MDVFGINMIVEDFFGRQLIIPIGIKKIERNVERDQKNKALLESLGWKVLIIWECQLKKKVADQNLEELYDKVIKAPEDRA